MPKSTGPTSAEEKIHYIFTVLKHTELNQPNYQAVAKETGHSSANHAQKKFKAYIEQAGFKLVDRQVIGKDSEADDKTTGTDSAKLATKKTKTTTTSPRGSTTTTTASTSKNPAIKRSARKSPSKTQSNEAGRTAKKRKVEEILEISDDDEPTGRVEEEGSEVKQEDGEKTDLDDADADTDAEAETDGDDLVLDENGDRFRRSRGRSVTLKAETVD